MTLELEGLCPLIQVYDMPTSLGFYRDVLGFEVSESSSAGDETDWCWLKLKGSDLMLNTMYEKSDRPSSPDAARATSHADVALFFGCPDIDRAYEHLQSHGIDVSQPEVTDYGMRQISFSDPDGYSVCFQWPASSDAA